MAAPARPHVRSSARRSASLDELPPTVIQQNPSEASHNTRRGKRPRDVSVKANESRPIKKQKLQPVELVRQAVVLQNNADPATTVPPVAEKAAEEPLFLNTVQTESVNGYTATANGTESTSQETKRADTLPGAVKHSEKRTLRSQAGGSRSKSELSWYFPNYDELVNDEPRTPDILTAESRIQIIDEPAKPSTAGLLSTAPLRNAFNKLRRSSNSEPSAKIDSAQSDRQQLEDHLAMNDVQRIEFPSIDYTSGLDAEDPLNDELYAKAHRRAERQEKQLRNIEKERAMHEKVQLERLLESLKGHDWLKVMGISGVTDGGKKSWEPKRDYFIREVEILLEKFREWKEEEKRRKMEREERLLAEEEDEESPTMSDDEVPDGSDVDACAARQLHREAVSARGGQARSRKPAPKPIQPPPVQKPFTSFYDKPHLREAALGKHRRGRTRLAFGQPLPNVQEHEFGLPQEILTPDALRASARSRRAAKRENKT